MAGRKSIMHPRLEELGAMSPSSSPLRRRSSIMRVVAPVENTENAENDDETERLQRRLEINHTTSGESEKRRSLNLGFVTKMSSPQIADGVSQCIKLSAENKINIKNAFSLEMINFMTYMIKKRDENMSNLQMASTSLDVSTKIYGFRVDGVHTDILKMSGGFNKQEKKDGRRDSAGDAYNGDAPGDSDLDNGQPAQKAKKHKKSKQKILATAQSLRCKIETVSLASLMNGESDSQTTDMLYQAILPVHATSDLYLHPYKDVILDTENPETQVNNSPVDCPRLEKYDHLDVCPPFANFQFLGWSAEEELDLSPVKSSQPPVEESGFQFDLDASVADDDNPGDGTMNYFDVMDDEDEHAEPCFAAGPPPANIVDFHEVVQSASQNRNFEYSYIQENMNIQNIGASHWKIRYPTKNLGGSRIVEGCGQAPVKRRKDTVLIFDEETSALCMAKFDVAKTKPVQLKIKTAKIGWSEEKITMPQDVHYDDTQCCKYYLRPDVIKRFPQKDQMNATHLPDDAVDYDYNNENDTTDYCPNVEGDDHQADNDLHANNGIDFEEEVGVPQTQAFTGDNLVEAPKMTNKIYIPFSQRAKKIDMRALKQSIWKYLITVADEENVEPAEPVEKRNADKVSGTKKFSDIMKNLPKMLSKANAEAVSISIAYSSLLHLANEHNLQIDSTEDRSDLIVRQA